jgi:hypothetical protein
MNKVTAGGKDQVNILRMFEIYQNTTGGKCRRYFCGAQNLSNIFKRIRLVRNSTKCAERRHI